MSTNYSVRMISGGTSDLERLTGRRSWEVANLASKAGWQGLPGYDPLVVSLAQALNVMIYNEVLGINWDPSTADRFVHSLRIEALIYMASELTHWNVLGDQKQSQEFFDKFYKEATRRANVARLLGLSLPQALRRVIFYSQLDVVCLTNEEYYSPRPNELPKLMIDAHELGNRALRVCGSKLFTATAS